MKVLLVGVGEFYHIGALFRRALVELGHECCFIDERQVFQYTLINRIVLRLLKGQPLRYNDFNRAILHRTHTFRPDVLLVIKGMYVSPKILSLVKQQSRVVLVNYATDDPFNPVVSTPDLRNGISHYDTYVCTKRAIMEDVRRAGCANVAFVPFAYEPTLHFPEAPQSEQEIKRFACDVSFVGGADADRATLLRPVAEAFPNSFHVYGGFWHRYPEFARHQSGMVLDRAYRLALGGAKINLGLTRRANRDGHTMRSFEIPACGGLMITERTDEHCEWFEDGKDVVFFDSDDELCDKVRYYVKHDAERRRIARAGYEKITLGKHTYRDRIKTILHLAQELG